MRVALRQTGEIFPKELQNINSVKIARGDMAEYTSLVGRMLACRKVGLMRRQRGVGNFFVVGKPGKDRQRPIWNGGPLSDRCATPLPPRRLGNPASFIDLVVPPGTPI